MGVGSPEGAQGGPRGPSAGARSPGPSSGGEGPETQSQGEAPAGKEVDNVRRAEAAGEAVRRSLSWRPQTGIAKGLSATDPLIPELRSIYERRIAKFEARGVWAALKVLDAWVKCRSEHRAVGTEQAEEVIITRFVEDQEAATGPLSTWQKLDWVRKHLKIEVPLHLLPKPAKQAGADGVIMSGTTVAIYSTRCRGLLPLVG